MTDSMDVDTIESIEPSDPLGLLRQALPSFIEANVIHALGRDYLSYFAPPQDATLPQLLRYILDKWISIFKDSPLAPHKHSIESLHRLSLDLNANSDTLHHLAKNLLIAIGRSSLVIRTESRQPVTTIPNLQLRLVSSVLKVPGQLPSIVLDGSNIAWRHSKNTRFSIRGVAEAVQYFSTRGHPILLILPESRLAAVDRQHQEDLVIIQAIKGLGDKLVTTPEDDYDDAYVCDLARRNCAIVVSNDKFRDHVYQMEAVGKQAADDWKTWFEHCRLSFTFRGDYFIPNPAFNWEKAATIAHVLRLT